MSHREPAPSGARGGRKRARCVRRVPAAVRTERAPRLAVERRGMRSSIPPGLFISLPLGVQGGLDFTRCFGS